MHINHKPNHKPQTANPIQNSKIQNSNHPKFLIPNLVDSMLCMTSETKRQQNKLIMHTNN